MDNTTLWDKIADFFSTEAGNGNILGITVYGDVTVGNILAVIIIAIVTYTIARAVTNIIRRILVGKVDLNNITFFAKLVRWLIYFLGFLVASPQLHIDFSGLMVAGGVVAVAIGFASQNTLSNFVAGVLLMFERPVSTGDNIAVGGTEGYVEEIGILSTSIRTYSGIYVRIPNSSMFSSEITNYVSNVARRFDYNIDIRYSDDAKKAIRVVKETIDRHPYALKKPAPSVYVDELGAHGILIKVRIWSPSGFWWDARTELLWTIFKDLQKAGVDMPFNQLTLWFGDEDAAKLRASQSENSNLTAAEILGKSEKAPENITKQKK